MKKISLFPSLLLSTICIFGWMTCGVSAQTNSLGDGLVAFYPFEGNANDVSGNNLHLSVVNATLTTGSKGKSDGGYYFNGTNSYLSVSNFPVPTNNAFSWSVWIKPEQLPSTNQTTAVMNLRAGVGLYDRSPYMSLSSYAVNPGDPEGTHATFWSYSPISAPTDFYPNFSQQFTANGSITTNTWQHLVITSDSNNIRRLYLNGRLESSRASSGYGEQYSTLLIGADIRDTTNHSGLFFCGSISSIRVYNRPLSDAEVGQLYQTEAGSPDTDNDGVNDYREGKDGTDPNDPTSLNPLSKGLVAYYPFDGNANDESGYSRHIETQDLDFADSRFCSESSALALTKAFSASSTIYFEASAPRTFSQWVKVVDFPARTDPGWFKQDVPIATFPQSVVLGNTFAADGEWWLDTGSGVAFYDFPLTTKWTQITVVYEGNVVEGKVYRNGVEVPLKSWVYPKTQFESGDYNPLVGIDGFWNSTNTSANNLIDEVRIYDRALSSLEVKSLFYETAFTVEERSFLSASPSVMGHYSLAQYNANRTNGQIDVTANLSAFNLFTQQQFDSNRTAGQSDVINNPMTYGLYTSGSIMDLNLGGVMIQKQGKNVTLTLQVEKTDDLTSMPFEPYGTFLLPVSVPGNKSFLRIRALQP